MNYQVTIMLFSSVRSLANFVDNFQKNVRLMFCELFGTAD